LLDTNLALLLLVGLLDRDLIGRFKRTDAFEPVDFDAVAQLATHAGSLVITPHVAAELSNLGGYLREPRRRQFFELLRHWLTEVVVETAVPSAEASAQTLFLRLGLTDASIESLARQGVLVITADFDLAMGLLSGGLDAINYNHWRPQAPR
jgi:hypothetical protein